MIHLREMPTSLPAHAQGSILREVTSLEFLPPLNLSWPPDWLCPLECDRRDTVSILGLNWKIARQLLCL